MYLFINTNHRSRYSIFVFNCSENGCGCRAWCQKQGHPGGICGDGHTCICSPKIEKKNEEYVRGQYKLTIINNAGNDFNEQMRQSITDTYFKIYPQIQSRFNRDARKDIQIKIDPNYDSIAYACKYYLSLRK